MEEHSIPPAWLVCGDGTSLLLADGCSLSCCMGGALSMWPWKIMGEEILEFFALSLKQDQAAVTGSASSWVL